MMYEILCKIFPMSVDVNVCSSESLSGRGYRFSKSPSEREAMLARRKEAVMDQARKLVTQSF